MRGTLAIVTFGAMLAVPAVARAQGECPDGWFCEQEAAPDGAADADDIEGDGAESPASSGEAPAAKPKKKPEQKRGTVVYHPANDGKARQIIIVDRPENAPPPRKRRNFREWGLNLRIQGVLMDDDDRAEDAGMGGIGISLRYRPIPHFAFDAGLDVLGGTDWAGHERHETALLLSGMVFFNPRSQVQFYSIGGIGFSGARVEIPVANATSESEVDERYSYFGAHLGLGLEFRVGRKIALNVDMLGFVRGRTDELADRQPEFTDPETGRVTNTSGGGLARAGLTFYW
jgi:opacity protein-like surface antigen